MVPPGRIARRRYTNVLAGVAVLGALGLALATIVIVEMRWLSLTQWPPLPDIGLLRHRVSGLTPAALDLTAQPSAVAVVPVPEPAAAPVEPPAPASVSMGPTSMAEPPATPVSAAVKAAPLARPRFAVEFGPFLTGAEAERIERRINEAGYQTVRFRQQTGAALYAVLIERIGGVREAQTLQGALRDEGFPEAVIVRGTDSLDVRVGEPLLLRGAVQLAQGLRARGHSIRVVSQPGSAETVLIRHGNFVTRDEAEARSGEFERLGLASYVVRAK